MKIQADTYDRERGMYSLKRYEQKPTAYFQYFFQNRRTLLLSLVSPFLNDRQGLSLVEIGCADGVLIRALYKTFPNTFSKIIGIDVSQEMISDASEMTSIPGCRFLLRDSEYIPPADVVIELGVHTDDMVGELNVVSGLLVESGLFVYCVAGAGSLHARLKVSHKPYVVDYVSYQETERLFEKAGFDIIDSRLNGFFIPKLWAIPKIARIVQPLMEKVMAPIFPSLFHEKIYILRRR